MKTRRSVHEIFQEASELAPDARAAYLDTACAEDPALRAEVESLLDVLEAGIEFMEVGPPSELLADLEPEETEDMAEVSAGGETIRAAAGESLERQIGRYKLLQRIGEGGFGSVWMAEQREPVRRRVAIKIIKLGMDTKQVIARFEAERQALAMMDHPHIARVFDAGATDAGRPYFVMELVEGVSVTTYCDNHRLNVEDRLDLFMLVCDGVQHAHQKGIIHRDLKPSNVLVTENGSPLPKVIDFGIAKAINQRLTERTLATESGQLLGTPAYMSPEQAETSGADIDTRSDIYSLGVLLYELLTGSTPFDSIELRSAPYAEIQRVIREQDPPTPSTRLRQLGEALAEVAQARRIDPEKLSRRLRGDLDWIVMRALEKDRNRRYQTASELAADVRRYVNHDVVLARSPGAGYRLRKFVRPPPF